MWEKFYKIKIEFLGDSWQGETPVTRYNIYELGTGKFVGSFDDSEALAIKYVEGLTEGKIRQAEDILLK